MSELKNDTHPETAEPAAAAAPRRRSRASRTQDIALIGVFAALMAVLHFTPPIPVGNLGVPITLGTLGAGLAGLLLGPWRGAAAVGLWLALGLLGLPVFSGFRGGLGVLAGPSAGYIIAFPVAALLTGLVAAYVVRHTSRTWWILLFAVGGFAAGLASYRLLGIPAMALNLDVSLTEAFAMDLVFWPGDAVKAILAAVIAVLIHRAYPSILVRR